MPRSARARLLIACLVAVAGPTGVVMAQAPSLPQQPPPSHQPLPPRPSSPQPTPPPALRSPEPPPVEKLGEDRLRIGSIQVDLKTREITVPGAVNNAMVLEFVANTRGGFKAYESLLTLDTNAAGFNLALIMIGLDRARSVPPRRHFDPNPPQGDPVEVWVEWKEDAKTKKVRAEDLIYNARKNETLPQGPWVYTGSVFVRDGRYLAELHGVLIGFVHTPAPIIENPSSNGVGGFGSFKLNPHVGLKPGTEILLTVRALPLSP